MRPSESFRLTGPRARDLVAQVEHGIASGALVPGDALPPVRSLAAELGISHNTVASAYRTLRQRAIVDLRGRRLVVAEHLRRPTIDRWWRTADPGARMLSLSRPDRTLVVHPKAEDLASAYQRALVHPGRSAPVLLPEFAEVISQWCTADGLSDGHPLVGHSSYDLTHRALRLSLRRGDRVAIEDPGLDTMLYLLGYHEWLATPLELDADGVRPESLRLAIEAGVRAVVLSSRAQHPTGVDMSEERADELREVLAVHPEIVVIELDNGFGTSVADPTTVTGVTDRWITIRNLECALDADLRIIAANADHATADEISLGQHLEIVWVSHFVQQLVVDLWPEAVASAAGSAPEYGRRRALLTEALSHRGLATTGTSGLNVWVPLGEGVDEVGIAVRLMERKWLIGPGRPFRIQSPPGLRITIADLTAEEVDPFVEDLVAVMSARPY